MQDMTKCNLVELFNCRFTKAYWILFYSWLKVSGRGIGTILSLYQSKLSLKASGVSILPYFLSAFKHRVHITLLLSPSSMSHWIAIDAAIRFASQSLSIYFTHHCLSTENDANHCRDASFMLYLQASRPPQQQPSFGHVLYRLNLDALKRIIADPEFKKRQNLLTKQNQVD